MKKDIKYLTLDEAYDAMVGFLSDHYRRTKSDDIGSLLGSMSLVSYRRPLDHSMWNEWLENVRKSSNSELNSELKFTNIESGK